MLARLLAHQARKGAHRPEQLEHVLSGRQSGRTRQQIEDQIHGSADHVLVQREPFMQRLIPCREDVADEPLGLLVAVLELLERPGGLREQLAPEMGLDRTGLKIRDAGRAELFRQARDDVRLDEVALLVRRAGATRSPACATVSAFPTRLAPEWFADGRDPATQGEFPIYD
ncbi:hypothetical protein ACTIVE_0310 [Actinomadura verrucosospora]|uniref:Uncharacterized protein n=2 Tax=Actinomadura verrucosospora TaxID=46165 RepID=A0A7D3VRV2_ACTVE|nr:hypothetical protein ACTIVE_0310 [Actinomadura verrucosospora]